MEYYQFERRKQAKFSTAAGIILTVGIHLCAALFGVFSGLKYIYPPPEEKSILIDFTEEETIPEKPKTGIQPKAVNPDPTRDIELVQRSEGQNLGTRQNEAPEATVGPDGDVEVPEPPRQKEINRRALFHSADNKTDKDTLAPQTASEITDNLKAGHASGTTDKGKEVGEPNAKLKGRTPVNGYLPRPDYNVQKAGTVVVNIKVDNYGEVKSAEVDGGLSTVTDKTLWQAAINAAKKARFNMTMNAPPLQEGTITYKFVLK